MGWPWSGRCQKSTTVRSNFGMYSMRREGWEVVIPTDGLIVYNRI